MIGKRENELLRSAYEQLGLTLGFSPRHGYTVYDSDFNEYACFMEGGVESSLCAPDDVEGFLRVSYFEHYKFPGSYKVIRNPFCGMSHEELELKLAVIGNDDDQKLKQCESLLRRMAESMELMIIVIQAKGKRPDMWYIAQRRDGFVFRLTFGYSSPKDLLDKFLNHYDVINTGFGIVRNGFYGMSQEEAELRLTIMGK